MPNPQATPPRRLPFALAVGLGFLLVGIGVSLPRRIRGPAPVGEAPSTSMSTSVTSPGNTSTRVGFRPAREGTPESGDPFTEAVSVLRASTSAEAARSALLRLSAHLRSLSAAEGARRIRAFLDHGEDVPTQLPFTLQADGRLASAPTLRTFLLDFLEQADPAGAAEVARGILARPDSADEWAIALRSFAKANSDPAAKEYLAGKFRELVSQAPWREHPSVGFLEAFDIAVHLQDARLLPVLGDLAGGGGERATAHAAALSLERIAVANPALLLTEWAANPGLLGEAPGVRANCFSRAAVSDARQRLALESYLASPNVPGVEIAEFAAAFPNRSFRVSPNLLTASPSPRREQIAAEDRAALEVLNAWVRDPRFATHRDLLRQARDRVADYVRQAARP